jgi:hypothetical protein
MSIKRGDRMFVQLSALGECDAKGKTVLSVGFKGRAIAEPDRPLVLAIGLIEQLIEMARYSSAEALQADLEGLVAYVGTLGRRARDHRDAVEAKAEVSR